MGLPSCQRISNVLTRISGTQFGNADVVVKEEDRNKEGDEPDVLSSGC